MEHIKIKFEHLEKTAAIKDYVEKKLELLLKFNGKIMNIDVTLSVAKGGEQTAKANLHAPGEVLHAHATSTDLYYSIDELERKLAEQVKKHHGKLIDHRY